MSDDLVKQSITELQDLVRCRCHEAYRVCGLRDPDCHCDSAETVKVIADRIEYLEAERDYYAYRLMEADNTYTETHLRIEELEAENEKLHRALELYERERARYRHAKPEMTGAYYLAGGHGPKDDNQMPQFVEICPAYGVGWTKIYEDTGRTISLEGS